MCAKFKVQQELFTRKMRARGREKERERKHFETFGTSSFIERDGENEKRKKKDKRWKRVVFRERLYFSSNNIVILSVIKSSSLRNEGGNVIFD